MDAHKIPTKLKYDGSNFAVYRRVFSHHATSKGFKTALTTDLSSSSDEKVKALDAEAQYWIMLTVEDNLALELSRFESAKAIWDELVARFATLSKMQILAKKRAFFSESMKPSDTVDSFISRLEGLAAELAGQKSPVADDDRLAVLLNGLSHVTHLVPTLYSIEQDPKATYASALLSIRQGFRSFTSKSISPSSLPVTDSGHGKVKLEANRTNLGKADKSGGNGREKKKIPREAPPCDICSNGESHFHRDCPLVLKAKGLDKTEVDKKDKEDKKRKKKLQGRLCRLTASATHAKHPSSSDDAFGVDSCASTDFAPLPLISYVIPGTLRHAGPHDYVYLADRQRGPKALFYGDLMLRASNGGGVRLDGVCFARGMAPLISMPKWIKRGLTIHPRGTSITFPSGVTLPTVVNETICLHPSVSLAHDATDAVPVSVAHAAGVTGTGIQAGQREVRPHSPSCAAETGQSFSSLHCPARMQSVGTAECVSVMHSRHAAADGAHAAGAPSDVGQREATPRCQESAAPSGATPDSLVAPHLLATRSLPVARAASAPVPVTRDLVHQRLAHPRAEAVDGFIKRHGVKVVGGEQEWCTSCTMANITRSSVHRRCTGSRAEHPLYLLHIDTIVSTQPTLAGNKYAAIVTDDATSFRWSVLSKTKDGVGQRLVLLCRSLEREHERKIKEIRIDQGGEHAELVRFCEANGILVTPTPAGAKEMNGTAERSNGIAECKCRVLLAHSGMPTYMWGEALPTGLYLHNRTPPRPGQPSPYERLFGRTPSTQHLRVFGCRAYVRDHTIAQGDKFSPRAVTAECRMVGYAKLGYRIAVRNPVTGVWDRVVFTRDVVFDERDVRVVRHRAQRPGVVTPEAKEAGGEVSVLDDLFVPYTPSTTVSMPVAVSDVPVAVTDVKSSDSVSSVGPVDVDVKHGGDDDAHARAADGGAHYDDLPPPLESDCDRDDDYCEGAASIPQLPEEPVVLRRSGRHNLGAPPTRLSPDGFNVAHAARVGGAPSPQPLEPKSWQEAAADPRWRAAATAEMESLRSRGVYVVVKRGDVPRNQSVFPSKWVWKQKVDGDGKPTKAKARVVACGNFQPRSGNDNSSPVARTSSVRLVFATSVLKNLTVTQYDCASAYLEASLDKPEYVLVPPGARELGLDLNPEGNVLKLEKALYGLRQSGKAWNKLLHSKLLEAGLRQSQHDPCLYYSLNPYALVVIIVDDIFAACEASDVERKIHTVLSSYFEVTRTADPSTFLGLALRKTRNGLHVSLPGYIAAVLDRFGMANCKSVPSPAASEQDFGSRRDEEEGADIKTYQCLVGCLGYIGDAVRSDIVYAVRRLQANSADPGMRHLAAAKRVLRYLAGSAELGILFRYDGGTSLVAFSDADHGAVQNDRYSVTGAVLQLAGAPISVVSRTQNIITLSSTEAELVAASDTAKEIAYLRMVMSEIGFAQRAPTVLHEDNTGVVAIASSDAFSGRTKHVDLRHKYVCEAVKQKSVAVQWISTKEQVADILTKALPQRQFEYLRAQLGIC
jgi:hypothetical protein